MDRRTVVAGVRPRDLPQHAAGHGALPLPPGDPAWGQVNCIGDAAHVVFPRTAVEITPAGTTPLAADANRVLLYDAGQEYRRAPLDPRGDDCLFVALGEEAVHEVGRRGRLVDPRCTSSVPPR